MPILDDTLDVDQAGHVEAHEFLHTRYNNSVDILSGTFATRPAFGVSGRLYIATDTLELFRDTGTSWDEIADPGGSVAAAIAAHVAAADPHATYMTSAEVDSSIAAHAGAADPHPTYLTAAEGNAAYEATGAVATHAAAGDPHTGYQKESEKSAASGYASLDGTTKVPIAELPTGTTGTTVALGNAAAGLIATHEAAADPHAGYVLESLVDAAGDLIVGTADNTVGRLAKGTDGTFLGVVSGSLAYAAPSGGGDIVAQASFEATNINSTSDVTLYTRAVTGLVAGDVVEIEATILLFNNTAARTYVATIDWDSAFDNEISTSSLAASGTNRTPLILRSRLVIQSSSLAYHFFSGDQGSFLASGGDIAVSSAGGSQASLWSRVTSDLTGSTTVDVKIRSDSVSSPQQASGYIVIRKIPATS